MGWRGGKEQANRKNRTHPVHPRQAVHRRLDREENELIGLLRRQPLGLAGGSELATACGLVYVAEDAKIGYPPTRLMIPPDMQFHPWLLGMRRAMEMYLVITGVEAAQDGFATRAYPAER